MRRIVFIIHTEFHLIEAISYILNNFQEPEYEVSIYRIATINSKRLDKYKIQEKQIPGKYRVVRYANVNKYSRILKETLREIVELHPEKLIFFDEGQYWLPYLMRKLKKGGCTICMAPDGANVYSADKLTVDYLYKYTIHYLLFVYSHRLIPPIWPIIHRHHYGYSKYIDELWMEYPKSFYNYYKRTIVQQPVYNTEKIRTCVNSVFGLHELPESFPNDNSIVFFDAPLNEMIIDICHHLLVNIREKYRDRNLYIKLHPHSSKYAKDLYKTISGIEFLPNEYPAELYIQNIRNGIFISAYSNCLFSYNPTCSYFWIYPMFGDLLSNEVLSNPTDFIQEVSSEEQLFDSIKMK